MMRKVDMDESKARKIYETYQYANNALGHFISEIKSSPLGEKTIISASGDHRLREYSISFPEDLGTAHSVPFYLYVPDNILKHTNYKYQANRIGSHRDIFPTLYAFSLSNAKYTSLGGRNLLAVNDIPEPYAHNNGVTLTNAGASYASNSTTLYPWKNSNDLTVNKQGIPNLTPNLDIEHQKLQTLYINAEIKGFQSN
ncbi:phosphoglycerol transferase [Vibrio ponticus]|nr:phosphoglycerol transferase [Vibrio ponticus]